MFLDAGLAGREPPGREIFPPIWDAWNARSPEQQAAAWRSSDAEFVARFESLDDEQFAGLHLDLFGMELDATGLARLRLSEHTMHTWDVAVALDPAARLAADGVNLLAGTLGQFAGPLGKPQGDHFRVSVHAASPRRELLLTVADSVQLTDDDAGEPAGSPAAGQSAQVSRRPTVSCGCRVRPSSASCSGGSTRSHTPAEVAADGVSLDKLRAVFPGF